MVWLASLTRPLMLLLVPNWKAVDFAVESISRLGGQPSGNPVFHEVKNSRFLPGSPSHLLEKPSPSGRHLVLIEISELIKLEPVIIVGIRIFRTGQIMGDNLGGSSYLQIDLAHRNSSGATWRTPLRTSKQNDSHWYPSQVGGEGTTAEIDVAFRDESADRQHGQDHRGSSLANPVESRQFPVFHGSTMVASCVSSPYWKSHPVRVMFGSG